MQNFSPYVITHLHLEQSLAPAAMHQGKGSYLVFWWKDIALGHLFFEAGTVFTNEEYNSAFIKAIEPVINFYSIQANSTGEWKNLLLAKEQQGFNDWMEKLLAKWLPAQLPATVPVSIIICTRDRPVYLQHCLEMLLRLRCLPQEIIVVDNDPQDDSSEEVVKQFPQVTYVREPRGGLSIARNTGLLHAAAPLIAFTDDDAIVHPLWLYRVWETFEDPVVAAMTGLVLSYKLDTEAQFIFEKFWSFNHGFVDKVFDTTYFNSTIQNGTPVWDIGAGVNMAFRKSVFNLVGNFDARLGAGASGCSEDSELWYRMLLKGMVIKYNPRAITHHEHRPDFAGLKQQLFSYMKGHTVAALLQHDQHPSSGYKKRIYKSFPKNYLRMILQGFPGYHLQFRTLWSEIRGVFAGIMFYKQVK